MKKARIIYGAFCVAMAVFAFSYREYLSMLAFAMALLLPLGLYLLLRHCAKRVEVELLPGPHSLGRGESFSLQLQIKNRGRLPIARCQVELLARHQFYGDPNRTVVETPVFSKNTQTISYSVAPRHTGKITFSLGEVRLYDFLGITCIRLEPNSRFVLPVLPAFVDSAARIGVDFFRHVPDSNTFSRHRRGDDSSETFKLREYQPGDRINHIHWKLTAKVGEMIVKESSFPLQDTTCIFLELYRVSGSRENKNYLDAILETLCVLSPLFLQEGIEHTVYWYDLQNGGLASHRITDEADLFGCLDDLFDAASYTEQIYALQAYCQNFTVAKSAQVLYLAPIIETGPIEQMGMEHREPFTFFYIHDFDHCDMPVLDRYGIRCICVDSDHPEGALQALIL